MLHSQLRMGVLCRDRIAIAKQVEAGALDSSEAGIRALPMMADGTISYLDSGAFYMPPPCHALLFGLVSHLSDFQHNCCVLHAWALKFSVV